MALDRLTKVDGGGISTTSDYRVGIITASKFVGPFDGSGGNFSGVVTATNGVFSGNISAVDGTFTGNISGVDGNFSGNVSIGGTLTYEDVTNIDSVGIITAQSDIHVGAGVSAVGVGTFSGLDISGDIDVDGHTNLDNVSVVGMATFSGNIDLGGAVNCTNNVTISGTAPVLNFIDTNQNPDFSIQNDAGQLKFKNTTSNEEIAVFTATGLYSDNINVTGDLDVDGHTNLDNVSIAGVTTFTGITTAGVAYATDFKAPDGNTNGFYAGNSDDLHLFHNGADSYIENDTGNLTFTNKNNNNIIFKT
ncbi:MAG: hypothetical protein VXY51_10065, partial [Pseudomonadota bacterium]|nr:hypothetical protein [Pseudomonadota bacterium]